MWYISLDYLDHQTSLNGHQARIDPDSVPPDTPGLGREAVRNLRG